MTYRTIKIEEGTPGYAAVNPNTNMIYISYSSANFILAVNIINGKIDDKIPVASPGNIVINSVTNKVYVSSAHGICEIDSLNNKYDFISVGLPQTHGFVDVNPITNLLYTTCFGHDILTIIDAATRSIADKIPVEKDPKGIAVDSSSNRIYIANNASQSISVVDGHKSQRLPDIYIWQTHGKWKDNSTLNPRFIIVNESFKLLYVKLFYAAVSSYGRYEGQFLLVINIDTGKDIKDRKLLSSVPIGFAFNKTSNTIYMKKKHVKAIQKLDAQAKKIISTTALEKRSFWQRFYEPYDYFAEVIAVNSLTNKVYVSDSKNRLLYEIEG